MLLEWCERRCGVAASQAALLVSGCPIWAIFGLPMGDFSFLVAVVSILVFQLD